MCTSRGFVVLPTLPPWKALTQTRQQPQGGKERRHQTQRMKAARSKDTGGYIFKKKKKRKKIRVSWRTKKNKASFFFFLSRRPFHGASTGGSSLGAEIFGVVFQVNHMRHLKSDHPIRKRLMSVGACSQPKKMPSRLRKLTNTQRVKKRKPTFRRSPALFLTSNDSHRGASMEAARAGVGFLLPQFSSVLPCGPLRHLFAPFRMHDERWLQ